MQLAIKCSLSPRPMNAIRAALDQHRSSTHCGAATAGVAIIRAQPIIGANFIALPPEIAECACSFLIAHGHCGVALGRVAAMTLKDTARRSRVYPADA